MFRASAIPHRFGEDVIRRDLGSDPQSSRKGSLFVLSSRKWRAPEKAIRCRTVDTFCDWKYRYGHVYWHFTDLDQSLGLY